MTPGRSRQGEPGFFSSERAFSPPLGTRVGPPDRPRGYYIDFTIKTEEPNWPPAGLPPLERRLHISTIQWALGGFERYVEGEGEAWLEASLAAADHLLAVQRSGGPLDGAWVHGFAMPHTFPLDPGWVSAITQGEGASLLVRLHLETGEQRLADAARRALAPMTVAASDGGTLADVEGHPFFEEYPTRPPSLVLNGATFALFGFHDVGSALGDAEAAGWFQRGHRGLVALLPRYDTGYWSRYDLYPHPVPNLASPAYHLLHIKLLTVLDRIAPDPLLASTVRRFEAYRGSAWKRRRAFAQKAAFRLLVPRNRLLAKRLPWTRHRAPAGDG